jgi:tRNA pseudouridine38-40 synthase
MRIALGLEYRGIKYCGWQTQPSGCAVQDYLESALENFLGAEVTLTCAGRTDTGVHAMAQVVHLDTEIARDDGSWIRGTNTSLPVDIRVLWSKRVPDDFHARFSAISRTYRYVLLNSPVDTAAFSGLSGWFHSPLDISRMREAAALLLGTHDFSAYRAAECQAKSAIKTMHDVNVEPLGDFGGAHKLIVFTFRGNAFLHHMIRNIVGELVYVGAGRRSVAEFRAVFEGRDRARAAPTFAPDGLYLCDIEYDGRFDLPSIRGRTLFNL